MTTETTIERTTGQKAPEPPRGEGPRRQPMTELAVTGMTCGNCARHVTEALQGVAGVRSASVSLEEQRATVRWTAEAEPNPAALLKAVEEQGFGAKLFEAQTCEPGERKLAGWQINLWVGLLGTVPLMIGEWGLG